MEVAEVRGDARRCRSRPRRRRPPRASSGSPRPRRGSVSSRPPMRPSSPSTAIPGSAARATATSRRGRGHVVVERQRRAVEHHRAEAVGDGPLDDRPDPGSGRGGRRRRSSASSASSKTSRVSGRVPGVGDRPGADLQDDRGRGGLGGGQHALDRLQVAHVEGGDGEALVVRGAEEGAPGDARHPVLERGRGIAGDGSGGGIRSPCAIVFVRGGAAAARRAHNPKVKGSNPFPATNAFFLNPGSRPTRGSSFSANGQGRRCQLG